MTLAEVEARSDAQYSDREVDDSLEGSSDRASQLTALIQSEIRDYISASDNWKICTQLHELLLTYIHGLHQLSRFNLKQYILQQLFTCYIIVSCDSSNGEAIAATVKQ